MTVAARLAPAVPPSATSEAPIVIVGNRQIGDFVRSHSLIRVCHAADPDAPIDVVTDEATAPLSGLMPEVRQAIGFTADHNRFDLAKRSALARRLRREGYAASIVLRRGSKAALTPFLAGIPRRMGVGGSPVRYPLVNRRLPLPKSRDIDELVGIARRWFGLGDGPLPEPRLHPSPAAVAAVRRDEDVADGEVVVAIVPGAPSDPRTWPVESNAALIGKCRAQGWRVWLIGGPADQATADRLEQQFPAVRNFTRGSLLDAAVRLAAVTAVVAKDGGLLHVAAGLGRPTVALFGVTDAWAYAPINAQVIIMTPDGAARRFHELRPSKPFAPAPLSAIATDPVFTWLSEAIRAAA